ncbi:PepSY domain-containing protein [Idiomarina tyrosinivorans]|uniref:PepSY domain-containing protein n=1 Tax=Idiomarina tyrosinivorans TaxID=1445662 RepID=A0A432ZS91_9GAMM|nr:PepSY-associated TM helix domain-containing protein [Idiomarina tyrosinivorans]RUO80743.1 PepSY domain-containing protein [Idiomarina tyrosinivorans]
MKQRHWFNLHGWFALPLWLLFCFICITGTLAVFSHELTWLFNPNARATNPADMPAKPIAELVEVVEREYPQADVTTVISFEPYLVNAIAFSDAEHPYALAYVNPYTGKIQEVNTGVTFINFIRSLHGWLLFPWHGSYSIGYYLVSAFSLLLLGSLITGLVIYKRFWRAFTQPKLRLKQGKKTVLADLHRLAGAWSLWFIAIMSATGLWYLTQQILWHNDIDIEGHAPLVDASAVPTQASEQLPVSFAQALEQVKQRYPNFRNGYSMLPEHSRGMYQLIGGGGEMFYDQYSYRVAVNPYSGEIAQASSPADMGVLETVLHVADTLHYGTFGGLWTKSLWFIFGLILSGMSITGFMMWGNRTLKASKNAARKQRKIEQVQTVQQGVQ